MRIPAPQRTDQGHEGARVEDSEVSKWTRCVRTKKPHLKPQLSRYSPIPKKELLDETLAVVYRAKYLAYHLSFGLGPHKRRFQKLRGL